MNALEIHEIAYHRNGISGAPFHVVTFSYAEGTELDRMIATVFDEPGEVAVLNIDKLAAGDIGFGTNSWRGDHFEAQLRQAIGEWDLAQ
jgi:hypothetical protein